jgi:integrase/recombinase XerC
MKATDQPLESYFALYRLSLEYENKSPATLSIYFRYLSQFHRWLAQHLARTPDVADLSVENVQAYVAHLRSKKKWDNNAFVPTKDGNLSPFTVVGHVRTLKGFATWLYEQGHTANNVLKRLPLPKTPTPLVETLSEAEIQRVFASVDGGGACGVRNYAMILLFPDSGVRCSELCGLKLADAHLEKEPGWIKVLGKGDKAHILVLDKAAHRGLLTYKTVVRTKAEIDSSCTDWNRGPMTPNTIQKADLIAKQAGIPRLHAHLLRHTAATHTLVGGGDAILLQQKLGHTTLAMTPQYVHLAAQHLVVINDRVSPMDNVEIKPLNRPYRQAAR